MHFFGDFHCTHGINHHALFSFLADVADVTPIHHEKQKLLLACAYLLAFACACARISLSLLSLACERQGSRVFNPCGLNSASDERILVPRLHLGPLRSLLSFYRSNSFCPTAPFMPRSFYMMLHECMSHSNTHLQPQPWTFTYLRFYSAHVDRNNKQLYQEAHKKLFCSYVGPAHSEHDHESTTEMHHTWSNSLNMTTKTPRRTPEHLSTNKTPPQHNREDIHPTIKHQNTARRQNTTKSTTREQKHSRNHQNTTAQTTPRENTTTRRLPNWPKHPPALEHQHQNALP